MSSIERAMSRLAGDGDETEVAAVAIEQASTAPTPSTPTPPVPSEDPSAAPPPVMEEAPVSAPSTAAAPESPAASAKPATAPAAPTAAATRAAAVRSPRRLLEGSGVGPEGNFVHLDLERLAAAGFLTPDLPMNRQSEEFQHIKRRLLGNMVPGILKESRPTNLVLITSSVPGEGKTFTSTNLAISIAMEVDHTVLAIDTDIMKRDLSKVFGVVDRPGLFDLLSDPGLHLPDLLVRTSIPNLVVLPAGHRREGSTELLASVRMRELTDEIATRYHDRVVLFDSPPVLATTTATALAPLVGQIVLVAEAGSTKHETIREALQRLDRVHVTGVILNKSKQQSTPGYDYYGSYYQTRR